MKLVKRDIIPGVLCAKLPERADILEGVHANLTKREDMLTIQRGTLTSRDYIHGGVYVKTYKGKDMPGGAIAKFYNREFILERSNAKLLRRENVPGANIPGGRICQEGITSRGEGVCQPF